MTDFVAIDVETANNKPSSVCSIGAVKVANGIITDRYHTLVRPTPNLYLSHFTNEIHHIGRKDTDSAPTFAEIWPELKKFINDSILVAHNSHFDRECLRAAAKIYGIEFPDNPFLCTLQRSRKGSADHTHSHISRNFSASRSTSITTPLLMPNAVRRLQWLSCDQEINQRK